MRPLAILMNLIFLGWFIALQYFRFKNTGRACSGDFLKGVVKPGNYSSVYLTTEGSWFYYYIILQYSVFLLNRMGSLIISNRYEVEFEDMKSRL